MEKNQVPSGIYQIIKINLLVEMWVLSVKKSDREPQINFGGNILLIFSVEDC